jgi:hypothetical protein
VISHLTVGKGFSKYTFNTFLMFHLLWLGGTSSNKSESSPTALYNSLCLDIPIVIAPSNVGSLRNVPSSQRKPGWETTQSLAKPSSQNNLDV